MNLYEDFTRDAPFFTPIFPGSRYRSHRIESLGMEAFMDALYLALATTFAIVIGLMIAGIDRLRGGN